MGFITSVFSSVIIVAYSSLLIVRFQATFSCYRDSTIASKILADLHRLWALPWLFLLLSFSSSFVFCVVIVVRRVLRIFSLRCFLSYINVPYLVHILSQLTFLKACLVASCSTLKATELHAVVWNTVLAQLFVWITQQLINVMFSNELYLVMSNIFD